MSLGQKKNILARGLVKIDQKNKKVKVTGEYTQTKKSKSDTKVYPNQPSKSDFQSVRLQLHIYLIKTTTELPLSLIHI